MKKILSIIGFLTLLTIPALSQGVPPAAGAFTFSGSSWEAAVSTSVTAPLAYTPPPAALYCYNSTSGQWVPFDASCQVGGAGVYLPLSGGTVTGQVNLPSMAIQGYFVAVTTFASGLSGPFGLAFDSSGNLYVSNNITNTVSKVTPAGVVTIFASGFASPWGLAFDSSGNLYVSNYGTSTVSKVTPAGVVTIFASGFASPIGLAFDSSGNLYVANAGANTVSKVTPAGVVTIFASGFASPWGLAFDSSGNLYVSNKGANTVSKVTPAGVVTIFASGFASPIGLAFDSSGNLYVSNYGTETVSKVTPAGVVTTFASGFALPVGLAFDSSGHLYVANTGANTVSKVTNPAVATTSAILSPDVTYGVADIQNGANPQSLQIFNTLNGSISESALLGWVGNSNVFTIKTAQSGATLRPMVLGVGGNAIYIDTSNRVGIGSAQPTQAALLQVEGAISVSAPATTCSGACAVDLSKGNVQEITLAGNVTSVVFSNGSTGTYSIIWLQGATPYTVTGLPAAWYGMTAPASTATTYARQTCDFDGTNGYCGALVQNAD